MGRVKKFRSYLARVDSVWLSWQYRLSVRLAKWAIFRHSPFWLEVALLIGYGIVGRPHVRKRRHPDKGLNLLAGAFGGTSLLEFAVQTGDIRVVEVVLSWLPVYRWEDVRWGLHAAVLISDTEVLEHLLMFCRDEMGQPLDLISSDVIGIAGRHCRVQVMEMMGQLEVLSPVTADRYFPSPLYVSLNRRNAEMLDILLRHGVRLPRDGSLECELVLDWAQSIFPKIQPGHSGFWNVGDSDVFCWRGGQPWIRLKSGWINLNKLMFQIVQAEMPTFQHPDSVHNEENQLP